ncbi:MAG TPA: hypothetical protein PKI11_14095 [Candidatus Hydrogenedentes bacterium]|nr:hypothetical protein [Candidatus Hydrogenedentota bacterium]
MYDEKGLSDGLNVIELWFRQVISTIASTILLPLNFLQALFNV